MRFTVYTWYAYKKFGGGEEPPLASPGTTPELICTLLTDATYSSLFIDENFHEQF